MKSHIFAIKKSNLLLSVVFVGVVFGLFYKGFETLTHHQQHHKYWYRISSK